MLLREILKLFLGLAICFGGKNLGHTWTASSLPKNNESVSATLLINNSPTSEKRLLELLFTSTQTENKLETRTHSQQFTGNPVEVEERQNEATYWQQEYASEAYLFNESYRNFSWCNCTNNEVTNALRSQQGGHTPTEYNCSEGCAAHVDSTGDSTENRMEMFDCVDVYKNCFALRETNEVLKMITGIKTTIHSNILLRDLTQNLTVLSDKAAAVLYAHAVQFSSCEMTRSSSDMQVVGRCPTSVTGRSLKEQCEQASPPLLPPVTVNLPVGELTFRNIFCARCHGFDDTNVEVWHTSLNCQEHSISTINKTFTISNFVSYIKTGVCNVIFTLPTGIGNPSLCHQNAFQSEELKETLNIKVNTSDCNIENVGLCQPYFCPVSDYNNPYSTYCLQPYTKPNPDLCDMCAVIHYSLRQSPSGGSAGKPEYESGGLLIILDISGTYSQDNQLRYLCKETEVFDPFMFTCKELICPPWSDPYSGKCYNYKDVYFMTNSTQIFPNGWKKLNMQWVTSNTYDMVWYYNFSLFLNNLGLQTEKIEFKESVHEKSDSFDYNSTFSTINCRTAVSEQANLTEQNCELLFTFNYVSLWFTDTSKQLATFLMSVDNKTSRIYVTNMYNLTTLMGCSNGASPKQRTDFNLAENEGVGYAVLNYTQVRLYYSLENIGYELMLHDFSPSQSPAFNETVVVCETNKLFFRHNCHIVSYSLNETYQNNSRLKILNSGKFYEDGDFEIQGNQVFVCSTFQYENKKQTMAYLIVSFLFTIISIIFLLLVVVLYCLFPELQTLPGKMIASLAATMMLTFLFNLFTLVELHHDYICPVVAAVSHVVTLAHFGWMSAIAINMALTFSPGAKTLAKAVGDNKMFLRYNVVVWGVSFTLVVSSVVLGLTHLEPSSQSGLSTPSDLTEPTVSSSPLSATPYFADSPDLSSVSSVDYPRYGFPFCTWFSGPLWTRLVFVIIPYFITNIVSIIGFVLTLIGLQRSGRISEKVGRKLSERTRCVIYIKLSTAMGFSWTLSILVEIYPKSNVLPYIFVCLVLLQGVLLFMAFMVNKRVYALVRNMFVIKIETLTKKVLRNTEQKTVSSRSV